MEEIGRKNQWINDLNGIPGFTLSKHSDWTGNPITRLKITIDSNIAKAHAWEISEELKRYNPSIVVRDHLIDREEFYLDPCNINHEELKIVSSSIVKVAKNFIKANRSKMKTWLEIKASREKKILSWGDSK